MQIGNGPTEPTWAVANEASGTVAPGVSAGLFDFRWRRSCENFALVEGVMWTGIPGWEHTDLFLVYPRSNPLFYRPHQENRLLHRTFADIDDSPGAIQSFANEWGTFINREAPFVPKSRLTAGRDATSILSAYNELVEAPLVEEMDPGNYDLAEIRRDMRRMEDNDILHGQPLELWRQQIRIMRFANTVWNAVQVGDVDTLKEKIVWSSNSPNQYFGVSDASWLEYFDDEKWEENFEGERWLENMEKPSSVLRGLGPEDVEIAGSLIVQSMANRRLADAVPTMVSKGQGGGFNIHLMPRDLKTLLWAQFALSLTGNQMHRKCYSCDNWFEIAPGEGRPEKIYCSRACQMRAYRKRDAAKKKSGKDSK